MKRNKHFHAVFASFAIFIVACSINNQIDPLKIKIIDSGGNPPGPGSTILQATEGYPPNERLLSAVMGWIDHDGIAIMHNLKKGGPIPNDSFILTSSIFVVNSDRPNATIVRLSPIQTNVTPVVTIRDIPFTNSPNLKVESKLIDDNIVVTIGNYLDEEYVLHEADLNVTIGTTARGFLQNHRFIGTIVPGNNHGNDVVISLNWHEYVTRGIWVRRHEGIDEHLPGPPLSNEFVYANIKVGKTLSGPLILPSPDTILLKTEESQHAPPEGRGDAPRP